MALALIFANFTPLLDQFLVGHKPLYCGPVPSMTVHHTPPFFTEAMAIFPAIFFSSFIIDVPTMKEAVVLTSLSCGEFIKGARLGSGRRKKGLLILGPYTILRHMFQREEAD